MKVVFIGAGNLATNLALELRNKSFNIIQVFSRTNESAQKLAIQLECSYTNIITDINTNADLYIFSVKDSALEEILMNINVNNGIFIHTAGSVPMNIFAKYAKQYGVVYPFQTFSKQRRVNFSEIPLFIEASTNDVYDRLTIIFSKISNKIIPLSSEKRQYIHLTGVFACNFVNHMYRISSDILKDEDISFDVLLPLINETAAKVNSLSPKEAQTGPAIRYDENIMNKHLSLLTNEQWRKIYKLLSKNIHELNN